MTNRKIAFVFPGQGSQYVGMGKDLYDHFTEAKKTFHHAADILGYDVSKLCFYGPLEELNQTSKTQPCILTASVALYRVIQEHGLSPSVVAGHSLGEYSALVAAEVFPFSDAIKITEKRGQFMQEAMPEGTGMMAAVLGLDREVVEKICSSLRSGYASPANYNCPGQIVIAGETSAVKEALEKCRSEGAKKVVPLAVSVPSHCKLMEKASARLADVLEPVPMKNAKIPVVNNADASFLSKADAIRSSLIRQLSSPLLWDDSIKAIADSGVNMFLEVGPGKVLSALIKKIIPDCEVFNVKDVEKLGSVLELIKK